MRLLVRFTVPATLYRRNLVGAAALHKRSRFTRWSFNMRSLIPGQVLFKYAKGMHEELLAGIRKKIIDKFISLKVPPTAYDFFYNL